MRIEVIIPPAVEPVLRAEAKTFCRVDADLTDEDSLIDSLITTAREQLEVQTSRAFALQTLRLVLDCFPVGDIIAIPRSPLIEVESIVYDDEDGAEQTFASSNYTVNSSSIPGTIRVLDSWPDALASPGSVRITYRAGYSPVDGEGEEDSELIPTRAKQAILFLVNHWYENRDAVIVGSIATVLPMAVNSLITPLKVHFRASE